MMDKSSIDTNVKLAPLRSLDDFILGSARFQIPNIKDLDKWGNRVINNMLYYQTNYIFSSVVIFMLVGLIHPVKMIIGILATALVILVSAFISAEGRTIHNIRKRYPVVGVLFILLAACFVSYTLGSMLVLLVGVLSSFSVVFVHASLRLRNIHNRISNKIERIGIRRTPMGIFLDQLDVLIGATSHTQTSIKKKSLLDTKK